MLYPSIDTENKVLIDKALTGDVTRDLRLMEMSLVSLVFVISVVSLLGGPTVDEYPIMIPESSILNILSRDPFAYLYTIKPSSH